MAEIMDVSDDSKKRKTTDEDKDSPDAVLDAFHRAASEADGDAYCAAMSDSFVFLGTDPTERRAARSGVGWRLPAHTAAASAPSHGASSAFVGCGPSGGSGAGPFGATPPSGPARSNMSRMGPGGMRARPEQRRWHLGVVFCVFCFVCCDCCCVVCVCFVCVVTAVFACDTTERPHRDRLARVMGPLDARRGDRICALIDAH